MDRTLEQRAKAAAQEYLGKKDHLGEPSLVGSITREFADLEREVEKAQAEAVRERACAVALNAGIKRQDAELARLRARLEERSERLSIYLTTASKALHKALTASAAPSEADALPEREGGGS